jgi:hypothetical protein
MASNGYKQLPNVGAPENKPAPPLDDEDGGDIVQFSSSLYFVDLTESSLAIDIMRLGSLKGRCSVSWETQAGSAKPGQSYVETAGSVTFENGEYLKEIKIGTIPGGIWRATVEFKVCVIEPTVQIGEIFAHLPRESHKP